MSRVVVKVTLSLLALVLLAILLLGMNMVRDQRERDRVCEREVSQLVERVERFRRERGRLPAEHEFRDARLLSASYRSWDHPRDRQFLQEHGAPGPGSYHLTFLRSERWVSYASWTEEHNCESGAWKLGALLAVLLLPALIGTLRLLLRRRQAP